MDMSLMQKFSEHGLATIFEKLVNIMADEEDKSQQEATRQVMEFIESHIDDYRDSLEPFNLGGAITQHNIRNEVTVTLLVKSGNYNPVWQLTSHEIDALEIHHDVCFTPKEPESALGYRGFCLQFPHKSVYVYDHYGTEEFLLSTWVGKESFDSAIYADVGEQLFYNLIKKS